MLKVYGCSDDLVEIEGSEYPDDEIDCYEHDVKIIFKDGTEIKVGYGKLGLAVWHIRIEKHGTAEKTLISCWDEDADLYSDVLTIDSEILSIKVVRKEGE